MNPLAKYLFALAGMICAYTAYARFAVPVLEGPVIRIQRRSAPTTPPIANQLLNKDYLNSLVPSDGWELEPCKTLLTPQGTVYFKKWERIDDQGTYKIYPFTLVINDPASRAAKQRRNPREKLDADETPVVLRSFQGAEVKFNKPLTANSQSEKATMETARLLGQVTIFRPPANDENELRVKTSNVEVNRQNIYTLNEVLFQFGPHSGKGRNLTIRLAHETEGTAASFSTINGIEQLELAFVNWLELQPVGSNDFGPPAEKRQPKSNEHHISLGNQRTPLRLSCKGPFVFRMKEQTATFREHVVITQLDSWGDNLHCDSLLIEFENQNEETQITQNQNGSAAPGAQGGPSVKRLVAHGQVGQPAVVRSNSRETTIVGEHLIFDVPTGVISAAGRSPVTIRNPRLEFEVAKLNYRMNENNRIGVLDSVGPGQLRSLSQDNENPLNIEFSNSLKINPLDSRRIQIDLAGNTRVKTAESKISAEELSFVLWELPGKEKLTAAAVQDSDAADSPDKNKWEYLPSKMTATRKVEFETDSLIGNTETLVANWPEPVLRGDREQSNLPMQPRSYPQIAANPAGMVDIRSARRHTVRMASFQSPALPPPKTKMRFSGDSITASVFGGLEEMKLSDLKVDGNLQLENKPLPGDTQSEPFQLSGDSLALAPQSEGLYRATLKGNSQTSAKLITQSFALSGSTLELDQTANTVWVNGAGRLNIDADTPSGAPRITTTTPPTDTGISGISGNAKLEDINIQWVGGMIFDGKQIYFERDILMKAHQKPEGNLKSTTTTLSQAMKVTLSQPFKFRSDSNKRIAPKLQTIQLVNRLADNQRAFRQVGFTDQEDQQTLRPIIIQNETVEIGTQLKVQQQKLLVRDAFLEASGRIIADGPGTVITHQPTSNKTSGQRLTGPRTDGSKKLTCVHVNFDGKLIANQKQNRLTIDGNTRTAWAPVLNTDRTLDPDQPNRLPSDAVLLLSDKLDYEQVVSRSYDKPVNVLQAKGNASVRGRLFEADAQKLRYDDYSDVMTIEGSSQSDARLRYRETEKAPPSSLNTGKIRYHLTDGWVQVDEFKSGSGGLR